MSGKRFRLVSCVTDWYIEDMKTSPFAVLTPNQASDLLNEFYEDLTTKKEDVEYELLYLKEKYEELLEENEQLKQGGLYWAQTAEARRKEIDKLRKDNSILKQQRDYLFDVIDEVLPHSGSTTAYNRMKDIGDVE